LLSLSQQLKKGAKYILLGYNTNPELGTKDPGLWATESNQVRFEANENGTLYELFCNPTDETDPTSCSSPAVVTLPENLECTDNECFVDHIPTVRVRENVYYEYVRPACVHEAFFPNPRKVKKRNWVSQHTLCFMLCWQRTTTHYWPSVYIPA
jgi:hypothetical protein